MSNNTNNDNKNNNQIEPKFNEYQAYEELRLIIARALEYGDFAMLEASIAAWEKKYPLDLFVNPEIIRKIKEILNQDFLTRIFGDFLARKLLHENEILQQYYTKLKEIINKAKKSDDYKTALKDIKTWKSELHDQGLSVASFDKSLKSKVCFFLLLPSKKIKSQEEAAKELKELFEKSSKLDKESLSREISMWQNKFSTKIFDKELQKEVNNTTAELLESVVNKGHEEESLKRIKESLASDKTEMPYLVVSQILSEYDLSHFSQDAKTQIYDLASQALFIQEYNKKTQKSIDILPESNTVTSLELHALDNLNSILNKNSHNLDDLISWIYETRNISFSKYSRDEIIRKFASFGYKVPKQASYSIPEINIDLSDFSRINKIQKEIIVNYLGIVSVGNSISRTGEESIKQIASSNKQRITSSSNTPVNKPIVLNVYNNSADTTKEDSLNDKPKNDIEIIIEDIIGESASYSIDLKPNVDSSAPLTISKELTKNSSNSSSISNTIVQADEEGILIQDTIAITYEQSSDNHQHTITNEVVDRTEDYYNENTTLDAKEEIDTQNTLISDIVTNNDEDDSFTHNKSDSTNANSNEASISPTVSISSYVLTPEDQSNLEEITYISMAFPIMSMALDNLNKNYRTNYSLEKNNGF